MTTSRRVLIPVGLALAVAIAFSPVLRADFVNWDDDANILRNPYYRGLAPANLSWMFTTFHMGHYQPLAWLTLGLDYVLWGMNPAGYHFTNLLLHGVNTILCYLVFLGLLRRVRSDDDGVLSSAAALGALFYGIHPLRVESVAWVTERRDVLCGFFFLLSILSYLRMLRAQAEGTPWKRWLALSCAAFAASLLSKSLGIMLPFLLFALDVYPLRRVTPEQRKRVLLEKLPFLVLAVADGILMMRAMSALGQVRATAAYAPGDRLLQGGYGLWFYLWKTVLPLQLHAMYALADWESLWRAEYVGPLIASILVSAGLLAARRRWPAGLATWVCYAILLAPVLGFFVKGYQRAADRYSYLSCLPFSFLAAAGIAALLSARRGARIPETTYRVSLAGAATGLGLLALITFFQSGVWTNSITLWDRVLLYERRGALPFVNRGTARAARGDTDGALADLSEALRINPQNEDAIVNRGLVRHGKGDLSGAMRDYTQALTINPRSFEAWNNRAILRTLIQDWDGALRDIEQALRLRTSEPEPYVTRAGAREAKGDLDGALADCETALHLAAPNWRCRGDVESMIARLRKRKTP
ncbi:MAG TPA: tetratricopeptide repeat protein [Planctomycetota bacterium]|jgi:tetratricopeptide (TPR) repeat protein|nr:tetratricopeptide repeat protein [Planctomycetota bacterium]